MADLRLLVLVLGCLLTCSCEKKEQTKRCIYDDAIFAQAADEGQFSQFKRNPFFNLLWENHTREEGDGYLQEIESRYPSLMERFDAFRASDAVGFPRVFNYGSAGEFSPSTLRFITIAGKLQEKIGSWQSLHAVQIGAGYGGLCKILHAIAPFESYTIVDLPEQLTLAKKYLDSFGLHGVRYVTPDQLSKEAHFDLAISDQSFSEFDRAHQELFIKRILSRSSIGFLLGHIFPKHYGVVPLSFDDLARRLPHSQREIQEPTLENGNYFIYFKTEELKAEQ